MLACKSHLLTTVSLCIILYHCVSYCITSAHNLPFKLAKTTKSKSSNPIRNNYLSTKGEQKQQKERKSA
jgi:hypothetical protein